MLMSHIALPQKVMRIRRLTTTIVLLFPFLAGCAWMEPMLVDHQCAREAANRPDAVQRKAECQQRLPAEPQPGSQRTEP
jgi:hypothetical protein